MTRAGRCVDTARGGGGGGGAARAGGGRDRSDEAGRGRCGVVKRYSNRGVAVFPPPLAWWTIADQSPAGTLCAGVPPPGPSAVEKGFRWRGRGSPAFVGALVCAHCCVEIRSGLPAQSEWPRRVLKGESHMPHALRSRVEGPRRPRLYYDGGVVGLPDPARGHAPLARAHGGDGGRVALLLLGQRHASRRHVVLHVTLLLC